MSAADGAVVAIVGGGASGTITAAHLLRRRHGVARVILIDRHEHGPGVAYSTPDPQHLLNVRASGMSAFDDAPNDLLDWCASAGVDAFPEAFIPRRVYGGYLRGLLARFGDPARLELVRGVAVDVSGVGTSLTIALDGGASVTADAVVLAVGNPPPSAAPAGAALSHCVVDPWAPGALEDLDRAARIAMIGTGMTAVDAILSIAARNDEASLVAISRHGWLPERHLPTATPLESDSPPAGTVGGDRPVPRDLASAMDEALAAGVSDWRAAIDALRPHTQRLWRSMPVADRRSFLAHHRARWDIHRHRTAPQVAARIDDLLHRGRLRIVPGSIEATAVDPGGVVLTIRQGEARVREHADVIVNATGPNPRIAEIDNPLIRALLRSGRATPDDLGIGLATGPDGGLLDAAGELSERIFTIGPPRRGELFESTAIPEIRAQAAQLGDRLTAACAAGPAGPAAAHRVTLWPRRAPSKLALR